MLASQVLRKVLYITGPAQQDFEWWGGGGGGGAQA